MTNPTLANRASRVAMLLGVVAVLLSVAPARATSAVQMDARALVGGRYEVGGWLAIAVTLVNEGEPTEGYVTAETPEGAVRRFVEMPAGARKVVTVYVQPEPFQRRIEVAYEEPNGIVSGEVEVRVLEQSSTQSAVVGDAAGTLRPQMTSDEMAVPDPVALGPADIPERPEPLAGLAAIIWAGDSSALTEPQRRSLERWIAEGGQLVVLGGADWQARTAAFVDVLPVTDLAAVDAVPQDALAAWAGADAPPAAVATVATGALRDDARTLIASGDGTVIASMRTVGAGRVVFFGTDLATDAHRGWAGSPLLWSRVMPSGSLLDQFMGGGFPVQEEAEMSLGRALNTLPSLDVPPAELLLAVIVAYILLIGPISYAVLRRVDRRELAWVTAPLLIVLFSASSFGIGRALKGSDVIVNQISLVRSSTAGTSASVESYAGVYSPDRATYDVSVDADALMARLAPVDTGDPRLSGSTASDVAVEQGDPAHLRGLEIGVFGFEGVRAVGIVRHEPALSVTWSFDDGRYVGTVTNGGETPVRDVAWISSYGGERVGDLEPGASADFTLPANNFNGSSASDQIYGFAGFDAGTEEQRQVQMRRQVIDALVGYPAFAPAGVDLASAGGRGPYVIGWTTGEGPMPIEVDGVEARRHATLVEVIAARPSLGSGEVTIRPLQMAINVAGTDGDVTPAGPGMVMVGTGTATFSIALPLEAANLEPTGVEIVFGPDPMMVASDQGSFAGFWPDGYTLELRNAQTGEWTPIGDLNDRSRIEIEDPATALSPTGRIEVRVSGTTDVNFGAPSIFVSAEVSGVIGE